MKTLWLLLLLIIPVFPDDVKPSLDKGSITIQANVFYGDQDEIAEPVETTFYLIKDNFVTILKKANFAPEDENGNPVTSDSDFLIAAGKAFTGDDDNSAVVSVLLTDLIATHKTAEIKTNKLGRGSSKPVKIGNYYLFSVKEVEGEIFIWHLPVQIRFGENIVELDQHNAEVAVTD